MEDTWRGSVRSDARTTPGLCSLSLSLTSPLLSTFSSINGQDMTRWSLTSCSAITFQEAQISPIPSRNVYSNTGGRKTTKRLTLTKAAEGRCHKGDRDKGILDVRRRGDHFPLGGNGWVSLEKLAPEILEGCSRCPTWRRGWKELPAERHVWARTRMYGREMARFQAERHGEKGWTEVASPVLGHL